MAIREPTTTTLLNQHKPLTAIRTLALTQTWKCCLHNLSRNSSLQQSETTVEIHNQSQCRVMDPSPNRYMCNTLPHVRFREHCGRGKQKDCKSHRIRKCAVRFLASTNVRSYTHKVSLTWLPKHELNKDSTHRHVQRNGEKSTKPTCRTVGN